MNQTKKRLLTLLGIYLAVILFFVTVNPEKLPLVLLLLPFLLIFITSYLTLMLVLDTFFKIKTQPKRLIAFSVSVMPVLLLIIQSITQLTLRDVLLSLSIVVIIVWYTTKINATP
jgi:hypothetical protein